MAVAITYIRPNGVFLRNDSNTPRGLTVYVCTIFESFPRLPCPKILLGAYGVAANETCVTTSPVPWQRAALGFLMTKRIPPDAVRNRFPGCDIKPESATFRRP